MQTHLVIPDSHTYKDDDLSRFESLSKLIIDRLPDTIINLGDFGDFNSLSSFLPKGGLEREGLRLRDDIDAVLAAQKIIVSGIEALNTKQKNNKDKLYKPVYHFLEANHEQRIRRLAEQDAIFEGLVDLRGELSSIYPLEWHEYGDYAEVDGILYTHVPFKFGSPIQSVVNTCGTALDLVDKSVVFGHTHRLEIKQKLRSGSNQIITALNAGCFFNGLPKYVEKSAPNWWRGVILLHMESDSNFDIETIGLERLLAEY